MSWIDDMRTELAQTPEGRAALADAAELEKYLDERPCSEGCCVELIDRRTGENHGGWGPVGCPCQDDEDSCEHDWTLRPESDTWVCEICGAER